MYNNGRLGDFMGKKRLIIVFVFVLIFIIAIVLSSIYYNDKYSIHFETGTEEAILTQYVGKDGTVKEPLEPTKEGFVFKEWQLNGETFNFDTVIKEDTVLTALWVKEEYVIVAFNTNTDEEIDSIKILKGDVIKELPIPNNEGYEFVGWYKEDKLYTNGEIYSDITLTAKYEKIVPKYEIGDKVIIIGKYAKSSKSTTAYNKRAIGWTREILNIIEGTEFPYVVGDNTGVTGFFKLESIERVE